MPGLDAVIKFRCRKDILSRIERLAGRHRRDLSDLLRIIVEDYAAAEEKRLGLPPMSASDQAFYLLAAEEPAPAAALRAATKPARYPPHRRQRES
jgi:hypothetical protein